MLRALTGTFMYCIKSDKSRRIGSRCRTHTHIKGQWRLLVAACPSAYKYFLLQINIHGQNSSNVGLFTYNTHG